MKSIILILVGVFLGIALTTLTPPLWAGPLEDLEERMDRAESRERQDRYEQSVQEGIDSIRRDHGVTRPRLETDSNAELRERYGYREDRGLGWRGPTDSERSIGSYRPPSQTPC